MQALDPLAPFLPPITDMGSASPGQWRQLAEVQRSVSTADRVLDLLVLANTRSDGFDVTQLTHCLQVATRAERAGADDEVVIAALVHDVAKAIPHSDHGALAAAMLRPHVRPEVVEVIRTHAAFQRRYTHHYLGGSAEARRRYRREPWFGLAEQFCEWDRASFDPAYDTLPLAHFEPRLRRTFDTTEPRRGRRTGIGTRVRRIRSAVCEVLGLG